MLIPFYKKVSRLCIFYSDLAIHTYLGFKICVVFEGVFKLKCVLIY